MSLLRIGAVVLKELREYRRNRFIVMTMALMPVVFLVTPMITLLRIGDSTPAVLVQRAVGTTSLLLLVVPTVIPSVIAAYSIVGEREQGTLEPFLTTPVRREELLLGKAAAAFVPATAVAYVVYAIYLAAVRVGGSTAVAAAIFHTPQVLAQVVFTPLLAVWSIWVGIAMSSRARDVRVAQQLATFASLPALGITALFSYRVVTPTVPLAVGFALALLALDVAAYRVVGRMFDRERLVTGTGRGPSGAT